MKQILIILAFTATTLLMFSCGSDKTSDKTEVAEQSELPPSLQPQNNGVVLVNLSEKEREGLKVETITAKSNFLDYSVAAPGVVFNSPEHASIISTPINGQIRQINKHEGSWIRKGEELFQVQSLEFGNLVSEYLRAFAEEQYQTSRLKRLKQLVEETISSASELEFATAEYQRSYVSVKAAYSKLKAIGVADNEIKLFAEAENIDPVLKVYSPIDGVIETNFVEFGQSVNALENLSRILDTRVVLIRGYLSPDDARLINAGDSVTISRRENQEEVINALVTSINPGLDENSRSVITNILVPTAGGWPKTGENVRLEIVTSSKKEIIAIPVESLTYDGNQAIVFVKKGEGIFEKRSIEVSEIRDKYVFVENGLTSGDEIALTKVFSLKALSRFDIISE
ncbi:MAG: efflux RND transporter periplasmic adaptor subunit [Prolixibacteraceae bacterium]|jgi:membrane fusion protein, heavy metal efflux system|nr:efflux RND transporter periplasmic adaptor subunit [Prolixibacteraceae bacterium]MBT6007010.1 efflux RND transporter periplasmic adaptor subunit [Prolixibacteraceae bacterium]MBT6766038.1 efflux RND transporter periplasmic adaptor subunit [Prolixibacteraceae bacterium]MBT6999791.1 efflux RND transporter periplasmic adaptor subunit [Prolixibacteraceae bacterium]MBT7393529.1 efflux RND transporter periplasmic adaptor subunit [Prolixibacteraceae bacterium]